MSAESASPPSPGPTDQRDYERRKARILKLLQATDSDWADWRWQARGVDSPEALESILLLDDEERASLAGPSQVTKATPHLLALSEPGDTSCPIRRQVIPKVEGAVEEGESRKRPILEHLSLQRARLTITTSCPTFCRYCFLPFDPSVETRSPSDEEIEESLARIREEREVREVILTGGEPLVLEYGVVERILKALFDIPHVSIIRIETRALSLMPQRFDDSLCGLLGSFGSVYLQAHFNHPKELTREAIEAAGRLARSGVVLQNGAVLLRGINDSPEVVKALHHALLRIKVRPAFLIDCAPPPRTSGFRADPGTGERIINHLRETTSGLAVPKMLSYPATSK